MIVCGDVSSNPGPESHTYDKENGHGQNLAVKRKKYDESTLLSLNPMKSVINPEPKAPPNTYLSVSGQRIPTKSKTNDLERYIA